MRQVSPSLLSAYRSQIYHTLPGQRLANIQQAEQFVNERGFVSFWPMKGFEMPSLWAATAGDRPVADEHDDPGHITWGWKDNSLGKDRWYYGRVLKRRNAFISHRTLPYFYALSPNYGEPETDYISQYEQGLMRPEAKWVYEALLNLGALDTIALREAAHLSSPGSDGRFNRAIDDLQMEFKILPIGIAPVGAWKYAFIYQCTHRVYPGLFNQVLELGLDEPQARREITRQYLLSVGAISLKDIGRLFGWQPLVVEKTVQAFILDENFIRTIHPGLPGEWLALSHLTD